jgi:uncharacterized protein YxeA
LRNKRVAIIVSVLVIVGVAAVSFLVVRAIQYYVKIHDSISELMAEADQGFPYQGAKIHYTLDIDNADFSKQVIGALEPFIQVPKPKKKKTKG